MLADEKSGLDLASGKVSASSDPNVAGKKNHSPMGGLSVEGSAEDMEKAVLADKMHGLSGGGESRRTMKPKTLGAE